MLPVLSETDLQHLALHQLLISNLGVDLDCFAGWIKVSEGILSSLCGTWIEIPVDAPRCTHQEIRHKHLVCVGRMPSLWIEPEARGHICEALQKLRFTHTPKSPYERFFLSPMNWGGVNA